MAPMPMSLCVPPRVRSAIIAIASSGADDPMAIRVAPATSLGILRRVEISSRLTTKKLSVRRERRYTEVAMAAILPAMVNVMLDPQDV